MNVELVTFDCAQTLVDVNWSVAGFAKSCTVAVDLEMPDEAFTRLEAMYIQRLPAFLAVNLTRDPEKGEAFWRELTADWLGEFGFATTWVPTLRAASDRLAFGEESILFRLYPDVRACLDELDRRGIKAAIVSNWDYTLHRLIEGYGLYGRFAAVVASLEEGVEKPDPRLFHICLERVGIGPDRTIHVGDDPVDDLQGAQAAGIRALLLDRSGRWASGRPQAAVPMRGVSYELADGSSPGPPPPALRSAGESLSSSEAKEQGGGETENASRSDSITSLNQLPEVLGWND